MEKFVIKSDNRRIIGPYVYDDYYVYRQISNGRLLKYIYYSISDLNDAYSMLGEKYMKQKFNRFIYKVKENDGVYFIKKMIFPFIWKKLLNLDGYETAHLAYKDFGKSITVQVIPYGSEE